MSDRAEERIGIKGVGGVFNSIAAKETKERREDGPASAHRNMIAELGCKSSGVVAILGLLRKAKDR